MSTAADENVGLDVTIFHRETGEGVHSFTLPEHTRYLLKWYNSHFGERADYGLDIYWPNAQAPRKTWTIILSYKEIHTLNHLAKTSPERGEQYIEEAMDRLEKDSKSYQTYLTGEF